MRAESECVWLFFVCVDVDVAAPSHRVLTHAGDSGPSGGGRLPLLPQQHHAGLWSSLLGLIWPTTTSPWGYLAV